MGKTQATDTMTIQMMNKSSLSWEVAGLLAEIDLANKTGMYIASKWAQRNDDEGLKEFIVQVVKRVRPGDRLPSFGQLSWACDYIRVVTQQDWINEPWYKVLEEQNHE